MDAQTAIYDEHPHGVGHRTGAVEVEEENHEKKPVLKKVKEKVKKIKDTISKKKHGHGDDHDHDHGVEEEGYDDEDEEIEVDMEVHCAPVYETTADRKIVGGQDKDLGPEGVTLWDIKGGFKEDPAAPKPCSTGVDEVGMSPVLASFQAMAVSDRPEGRREEERSPPTGTHDQSAPPESGGQPIHKKEPSYTEKITSTASAAKDAAVSAASNVYEKVAGAGTAVMGKVQQSGTTGNEGGDGRVVQPNKGVSVREFLAEKLRPGDEDRALSELISETIHKRKEQEEGERAELTGSGETSGGKGMVEKIRVAVTSLLGGGGGSSASPVTGEQAKGGGVVEGAHQEPQSHKLEDKTE